MVSSGIIDMAFKPDHEKLICSLEATATGSKIVEPKEGRPLLQSGHT